MSFGGRLGKADVIDSCDGILSDNKKEHITEKCYDMDKSQKCYAKWKNSDTKPHIV